MRCLVLVLWAGVAVGVKMDTMSMDDLGNLGVDDFIEEEQEGALRPLRTDEEEASFLALPGVRVVVKSAVDNAVLFEQVAENLASLGVICGLHITTDATTTIAVHRPVHLLTKDESPVLHHTTTIPSDDNLLDLLIDMSRTTVMWRESLEIDIAREGEIHITAVVKASYTDEKMMKYYAKRLIKGAGEGAQLHLMGDADGEGFMIEMEGRAGIREAKVSAGALSEFIDDVMAGEVEMHAKEGKEGGGGGGQDDPAFLKAVEHVTEEDVAHDTVPANSLILFYAPWCGHCQAVKPTFSTLSSFLPGTRVLAANVDSFSGAPSAPYEVEGFPTIYYKTEAGQVVSYNGDRSAEDIADFVAAHSEDSEL